MNTDNYRIFGIQTPDYLNFIHVPDKDTLLVGSALEGSYQIMTGLEAFLDPIFTEKAPSSNVAEFKYIFKERQLPQGVEKDTIFTTSHL